MERVWAFVQLSRPVFLLGGGLLYLLGSVLSSGPIGWTDFTIGLLVVTSTQLAAQYANEYYDLGADRMTANRRTWFTGGSGVLVAARLAPSTALTAARIATVVSLALLPAVSGWAAVVGVLALIGGWAYSAPPARAVATPAGVTLASLVVAAMTPLFGVLVQPGGVGVSRFLAVGIPLFFLHHAMLLAFERPDAAGDLAADKRTLTVRIGPHRSSLLHTTFLVATYGTLAWALAGPLAIREIWGALALAPLALLQAVLFRTGSDKLLTLTAVGLFSGTAVALVAGLA